MKQIIIYIYIIDISCAHNNNIIDHVDYYVPYNDDDGDNNNVLFDISINLFWNWSSYVAVAAIFPFVYIIGLACQRFMSSIRMIHLNRFECVCALDAEDDDD